MDIPDHIQNWMMNELDDALTRAIETNYVVTQSNVFHDEHDGETKAWQIKATVRVDELEV